MAIRVDKVIKQYEEVVTLLNALVTQVEEDIPNSQGTKHLWEAVDYANRFLCGPTRSYVDQG